MIPFFTKHYSLGLLVGMGFGLFFAGLLMDAGVITGDGPKRIMSGFGLLAIVVGGILYAKSLRKPGGTG
jgi:hypothetical protein